MSALQKVVPKQRESFTRLKVHMTKQKHPGMRDSNDASLREEGITFHTHKRASLPTPAEPRLGT